MVENSKGPSGSIAALTTILMSATSPHPGRLKNANARRHFATRSCLSPFSITCYFFSSGFFSPSLDEAGEAGGAVGAAPFSDFTDASNRPK